MPRGGGGQDRAPPQPRPLPALHPPAAAQGADPRDRAAVRRVARDEAFERMFERDKDELRELGIPLVTAEIGGAAGGRGGYRIDQREYALPDIEFEPDELAVLGLASRTWAQAASPARPPRRCASCGPPASSATATRSSASSRGCAPASRRSTRSRTACGGRVPLRFAYRRPEAARGQRAARAALGAGVVARPLVPHRVRPRPRCGARLPAVPDRRRGAHRGPRRVLRGAGRPRARDDPQRVGSAADPARLAVVRVRRGSGHSLRRRARTVGEVEGEWDLVDLDYTDLEDFADEVAGYGADVVVDAPPRCATRRARGSRVRSPPTGVRADGRVARRPRPPGWRGC